MKEHLIRWRNQQSSRISSWRRISVTTLGTRRIPAAAPVELSRCRRQRADADIVDAAGWQRWMCCSSTRPHPTAASGFAASTASAAAAAKT